jgi:hypothetical protein
MILRDGRVGQDYDQSLSATGGDGVYSFALSAGALPSGLNLSKTGRINGIPSATGSYSMTVQATDSKQFAARRSYMLIVGPACAVTRAQQYTPADGTKFYTRRVFLQWYPDQCATHYNVKVKQDSKYGPTVDLKRHLTQTSYKTIQLSAGHSYYWRAIACNAMGCVRSRWRSFTIPSN